MKPISYTLLLALVGLLVTSPTLHAQTTVLGQIRDGMGRSLPFASVALLTAADTVIALSKPVKGTATDAQGQFLLEHVRAGQYVVVASAVGYGRVRSAAFAVTTAPVNVPELTLRELTGQLNTVQVVAKKPFVEQLNDRMVVNVAGSIVGSGSTALEVLEKAPGVTVDYQNDRLQLRGKDGVIVLIDGRQSYLAPQDVIALLRTMSSDNIATIELITNPGARYDAAGNSGMINIRLKKAGNLGTNGTASVAGGTGRYDRERGSLQLNHRTAKLNLFGSYSLNRGGNYWDFSLARNQPDPTPATPNRRNLVTTDTYLAFRDLGQNTKAGLEFTPANQTTIGLVWTGFWSDHRETGPANSVFSRTESGPLYFQTTTKKAYNNLVQNQLGNVNMQHSFGKNGANGQLTADLDVGHFSRDFTNQLLTVVAFSTENTPPPPANLLTTQPTTVDILTAKVDYSRPLGPVWKVETGLKSASVRTDNDLTIAFGDAQGLPIRDPQLSTRFRYTERVQAAYGNLTGKWGKTDVQAGLRAEHTHSEGNALNLGQAVTRTYLNLFPSLFLTHPLPNGHSLSGSYSYRIDRPNYQNLNPSRGYIDPYTYRQGNAYLRPQYTHALEVRYALKSGLFASVGANFTTDLINNLLFVTGGNQSYIMVQNIGQSVGYTATLGWPFSLGKSWQVQTNWLAYYNQYQFEYDGNPVSVQNLAGRLNVNNALTLGYGWTAELTGWLRTPALDVAARSPWQASADAGVQKSMSAALKVKLTVQDMFHSNRIIQTTSLPGNRQVALLKFDTRVALLNVSYSFGNQKVKTASSRRSGSEDESRRAN